MRILFLLIAFLLSNFAFSQNSQKLESYLSELKSTSDKEYFYKKDWIDTIFVRVDPSKDFLENIKKSISNTGLKLYVYKDQFVFIYPNRLELERQAIAKELAKNNQSSKVVKIGNPDDYNENDQYELSGLITDESDGILAGVNILINDQLAAKSDINGKYSLTLKPGNYEVEFSYVGLEPETKFITFYSSSTLDVFLFESSNMLNEVVIEVENFGQNVGNTQVGVQKIGLEKLEKLPSFLGNLDVVKSATALPGVTVSGESSSYLNVRGGRNDQTLVLMNNTTIYNPGHLLGFFSVFNGDFVSEMTLFKGNIPARYGMRSSSVLDVKMNKWTNKKFSIYGGIGIANSNLGVKGKLLDNKLDYHVGGRISYVDWLFGIVSDKEIFQSSAEFGDANFSSKYLINPKNSIFLTSYYSKDYFKYANEIIYKWNIFNNGIRWVNLLNENWVLESEILTSSLWNSSESLQLNNKFFFENGISEYTLKSSVSNDNIEAGIDISNYSISPGEISTTDPNTSIDEKIMDKENLLNVGAYASYTFPIGEHIEVNPGLRFNYFMNYGPATVNTYAPNSPFTEDNLTGTQFVNDRELISSDAVLEPRIGVKYSWNNKAVKIGYSRINQFLHMISNTVLVNPIIVWKGSDRFIPPTTIDQYSLGYQVELEEKEISLSIDGFYKKMDNVVEYRNGATLLLNDNLEQELLSGEGTSYGAEFLLSKSEGRFSGLMSYTYSRSFIRVDDKLQETQINSGNQYPTYSDRPHNLRTSVDFKVNKQWTVSSNFTYISGAPISAPLAVYEIDGVKIPYFPERNSERIPDYHRLDLVVTLKSRIRKTKKNNDRLVFTFYNVYARKNIANIYFSSKNDIPAQPFKLINVGTIIPTVTYKFEF
jgi:hypothetical protein